MPKLVTREADYVEAAMADRESFEAGFRRSRKGNLWRTYQGRTLTVFRRADGRSYGWCVAAGREEGARFSPASYEDADAAIGALYDAVGPWVR